MSTGNPALDRAINEVVNSVRRLQTRVANLERGNRSVQLDSSSIDAGSLTINDDQGNPQIMLGLQPDGTYGIAALTGAPSGPPTPDDPQVQPSALGVTVAWDGEIGEAPPPANFAAVQVHCSTSPSYTPSAATLQGTMTMAGLFAIPNLQPGTTYYICLLVQDTAGNTGTQSDIISCVAGSVSGSFIAPNSINAGDVVMQGSLVASNIYVSYAAQVYLDNPVAWWKLDDPGPTTADDSGPSGYNGTASAAGVSFGQQNIAADAMPSTAFASASTANIVTTYQPPAEAALTVEGWLNLNGLTQGSFAELISSSHTNSSHLGFDIFYTTSGSTVTFSIGNGTTTIDAVSAAIPTTGWVHVMCTWDGTTALIYINGVQSGSATGFTGSVSTDPANFVTMGSIAGGGSYLNGLLSSCVIYNTALSAARVQAHYNARAGAIVADNIAADSITANHILAGTIVAGIVNGTIIEGATIRADGTSGQILVYQGTAAAGNLIGAWSGQTGADSFANGFIAGLQVGLNNSNQIQLVPNVNSAFNITTAIQGSLQAMLTASTTDVNEILAGLLGAVVLGTGTTEKMATLLSAPMANTNASAAIVLQATDDAAGDTAVITLGTVVTTDGGATVTFTPIMTLTPFAVVVYSAASKQTTVTKQSGSGTIPIPAGTTTAKSECWGGGGGGGGSGSGVFGSGGGGGGGGEYAAEPALAVTGGGTVSYAVGAAGTAGPAGSNGGNGGNSTLTGTSSTVTGHGGQGGAANGLGGGGAGGTGYGGTTSHAGGAGAIGGDPGALNGGGGGGSGGTATAGNSAALGTTGAAAVTGGGPGGNAGTSAGTAGSAPSSSPGGGGGGGGRSSGGAAAAGGAGKLGQVRLTYSTGGPTVGFSLNFGTSFNDQFGTTIPEGLAFISPADGNTYGPGPSHFDISSTSVTAVNPSWTNIGPAVPVAAKKYKFHIAGNLTSAVAAGIARVQLVTPAQGTPTWWHVSATPINGAGPPFGGSNTTLGSIQIANPLASTNYIFEAWGEAVFTASGTFQLQGDTSASGDPWTFSIGSIELWIVSD